MGRRALPRADGRARPRRRSRGAVDEVVAAFGRLDILVNNAGLGPANPAEDVTEADFDLTMDVNVKGLFFASQAAGRAMIAPGLRAGSSTSARRPASSPCRPSRSTARPRRRSSHLTKCLAVEWGTPRHHRQRRGADVHPDAGHRGRPGRSRLRGRRASSASPGCTAIGEPMDVAGAVVFLASPAASLITGTTLLVDGGWTAR